MPHSPGLYHLAVQVDGLLLNNAAMCEMRSSGKAYLAERVARQSHDFETVEHPVTGELVEMAPAQDTQGDSILFPTDPANPFDWTDATIAIERRMEDAPVLARGERAIVLAALHDVYCHGVEKVFPKTSFPATPREALDQDRWHEFREAIVWESICSCILCLGDFAVPWFTMQVRRFERDLSNTDDHDGQLLGSQASPSQHPDSPVQVSIPPSAKDANDRTRYDGPFEPNGFRFRGAELTWGKSRLRKKLTLALWDESARKPRSPRSTQEVIEAVYGDDEETDESTFRGLISDTRGAYQRAQLALNIRNESGKIWLESSPE
jgi:hypothetical protein